MMTSGLLLDTDDDLVLAKGKFLMVYGPSKVAQGVSVMVKTFRGEWFLNSNHGVPWFQEVLGARGVDVASAEMTVSKTILECPGVVRLAEPVRAMFDARSRRTAFFFSAITEEGVATGAAVV